MSLNFPASPKRGDTITAGSRKWKFTGTAWIRVDRANQGDRGFPGATGATGATGPAGATGPVEEFVASINGLTGGITTDGLTFAFAGISVGAFGITTDGAISFSGTTGTIEHPTLGNAGGAVVDIKAGGVVLGRFARFENTSTIGDVDQSSHGTRVEVTTKTETVDVYADTKLHLHGGVLFPESGISLGVGLTFPDGTFQSSAHAPHEFVASFNGATGAIEGVNSFNGLTGAVSTTDLSLQVAGISTSGGVTFSDGSHQDKAAERGYEYTVVSSTPSSAGQVAIQTVFGVLDLIQIHATDGDGNDLETLLEHFTKSGGSIKFSTLDGKTLSQIHSDYSSTARSFNDTSKVFQLQISSGDGFIFEPPNSGDVVYMTMTPNDLNLVTTVEGFTGPIQLSDGMQAIQLNPGQTFIQQNPSYSKETATFTISASSGIKKGKKTDSLHRFPYDATLTGIDVKVNGSGGFTAGAIIAGSDFGNPATSSVTGGTLGVAGTTGSITSGFNNTGVTAGRFMFFEVISNDSGSTQAQMFVSYERR